PGADPRARSKIIGFVEGQQIAAGTEELDLKPRRAIRSKSVAAGEKPAVGAINGARRAAEILIKPRDVVRRVITSAPFFEIKRWRMWSRVSLNPIVASRLSCRRRETGPSTRDRVTTIPRVEGGIYQ